MEPRPTGWAGRRYRFRQALRWGAVRWRWRAERLCDAAILGGAAADAARARIRRKAMRAGCAAAGDAGELARCQRCAGFGCHYGIDNRA